MTSLWSQGDSPLCLSLGGGRGCTVLRVFFQFPIYMFKGSLVDPRLRASNEHISIVRVPRAGRRLGCPSYPSQAARCASTGGPLYPSCFSPLYPLGESPDCPSLRASNELRFIVRVLR